MENTLNISQTATPISAFWQKSVPMVLQAENSECGLACLAMISGYFGASHSMRNLREQYGISSQGANLRQLLNIAGNLNLATRAVKLDLDSVSDLALPCILHWDMNHFVVLTKVAKNHLTIHDPALGKRKLTMNEFAEHFTGIAVECSPTPAFEPSKPEPGLNLWHFVRSAVGLKRFAAVLLLLSVVLQAFALVSPYYMQLIVDDVVIGSNRDLLKVLTLGFGLLLIIEVATHTFRQFLMLSLTSRLNAQLSANVFYKLIRLPFSFFHKRHLGDVVSRFGSLGPIRNMLSQGLIAAVLDGLMAIITLIVMFIYNAKLAFISLGVVSVYLLVKWCVYRPIHRLSMESLAAGAQENTHFMESVRAIKTIKLFEQETARQNEWQHKLVNYLNTDISLNRWQISLGTVNKLLFGVENLVVLYFAADAVMGNAISVGMLYAFVSYKTRFTSAMDSIINTLIDYRLLSVHFDRISDLVLSDGMDDAQHTLANTAVSLSSNEPAQGLDIKNVSYRYSTHSPQVFNQLNAYVEPGECVAIVGPSGSGKTTLIHCLMGLLKPESGHIKFQGQAIFESSVFRQNMAAVTQDDHCLSGSILNNIACFDAKPDVQRVAWAAQMACIHDDIMTMPMQYQTLVGDMGSCLSGGQLQRVLIARALYKQPQILFMDEATAHLDTETERKVNTNLQNCSITRIIIAHRPQTIAMADRVYRLQDGALSLITPEGE
jgi:ATP-binding cassette subfamily B protein RaxB